ncbi:lymphoid enhancer-binding factor 1 [Eurytemora carolleeae]|uniref:lymphoid enhancer-binding factor 1 n=1 Tax=Eurytemora carolleeae TaxID=1294199 RepID=UPI000C78FC3E|nr:lymphoid enhancer-binding factor 1 [Eurytemora carolleeae]|eukprot:XP_023348386.1 lymphoid enhancer-binding factor 1-like [Eurytemora affinis]
MPGVSGNVSGDSPDEFCSSDEVKVFKDEGEDEQEQNASECLQAELLEEKSSLITESEQGPGSNPWLDHNIFRHFQGKSELRRELGHTLGKISFQFLPICTSINLLSIQFLPSMLLFIHLYPISTDLYIYLSIYLSNFYHLYIYLSI